MRKRFLYTLSTALAVGLIAGLAIFLAKGYRLSQKTGVVSGTGIISINSIPDQASVYLDGHLTTASNANVNSLPPKVYDVKITKDNFIPWQKNVDVKEGLVSQVKATLFPAIPTVYPLTFNGVSRVMLSPDVQRVFYIVPQDTLTDSSPLDNNDRLRRSGIWVWELLGNPLSFTNGPEPHRVADLVQGADYSKATVRWSPDSSQILINLPDRSLLLDENKFNDQGGRDITETLQPTLSSWDADQATKDKTKLASIKSPALQTDASGSAVFKWSPDETKFVYSRDGKTDFKVADIVSGELSNIAKAASVSWLPDSRHIIMVEDLGPAATATPTPSPSPTTDTIDAFPTEKISIVEIDGSNKSEIYVGNLDPQTVFAWPDQSRIVIVSSVPTQTGNKPNLFGVNIK